MALQNFPVTSTVPRSPNEGAQTRPASEIDVPGRSGTPMQDRRVRSGVDRRVRDIGPPDGTERRRGPRRTADRRSHGSSTDRRSPQRVDRRKHPRRSSVGRRGQRAGTPQRVPRAADGPLPPRRNTPRTLTTTDRVLRGLLIVIVAVACLLAATLPIDAFAQMTVGR